MSHTASNVLLHLIVSTKHRYPYITKEIENDLHAYIGGIVREVGGKALIIGGADDHVHLLLRMPTTRSTAEMARLIKTNSSKWLHEKFPQQSDFAWQKGYGVFSVSESGTKAVIIYRAST